MSKKPYPPFMNSTGLITKILDKIIEAKMPEESFSYDYMDKVLSYSSGSAKPMLGLLKRIGFLDSAGKPTDLYVRFRSASTRGAAMAEGLRIGYADVFAKSEYAHEADRDKIKEIIEEITGLEKGNKTVIGIVTTFFKLKDYADFDAKNTPVIEPTNELKSQTQEIDTGDLNAVLPQSRQLGMNLAYTINLNLPDTDNIAVFNAIFKSLKENLLAE